MSFLLNAVTATQVFEWIGFFLAALLCLMLIIVIHELGHYIVGKLLGFKVDEFSIGFGPAILKYTNKRNGELFAIRCIPLGGYCGFHGETGEEDESNKGMIFTDHKPWKRILVFIAGAMFNLFSAVIFIAIFFMAYGEFVPKVATVYQFNDGYEQNIQEGDVILRVNDKIFYTLINPNEFVKMLNETDGDAKVLVRRNGEEVTLTLSRHTYTQINPDTGEKLDETTGYGFSIGSYEREKYDFVTAIGKSFIFCFKVVGTIFTSIAGVFTGALGVGETMGGTATAISVIMELTRGGFETIMYGICVLSASIGVMNLMPFPALDGSHVVFTTIEWIRKKPISRKIESIIHAVGLVLLFTLAIVLDIVHFVR